MRASVDNGNANLTIKKYHKLGTKFWSDVENEVALSSWELVGSYTQSWYVRSVVGLTGKTRQRDLLAKARNLVSGAPFAQGGRIHICEIKWEVAWGHVEKSPWWELELLVMMSGYHNVGNPKASSKELKGGKQI